MELFGDQVESLRQFDVASQRSLATLSQVGNHRAGHPRRRRAGLSDRLPARPRGLAVGRTRSDSGGRRVIIWSCSEQPQNCLRLEELMQRAARFGCVFAAGLATGEEGVRAATADRVGRTIQRRDRSRATGTRPGVRRARGVPGGAKPRQRSNGWARSWPTRGCQRAALHFVVGRLRTGFRLVREQILVISGNELFHRAPLRRLPRLRLGKAIDSFLDLREGDLVVHLAHGIGRYRGLELLRKTGRCEEHLEIEFHGGTKIYVPTSEDRTGAEVRRCPQDTAPTGDDRWPELAATETGRPGRRRRSGQRSAATAGRASGSRPASPLVPTPTGSRNSTRRFPTPKRPIN